MIITWLFYKYFLFASFPFCFVLYFPFYHFILSTCAITYQCFTIQFCINHPSHLIQYHCDSDECFSKFLTNDFIDTAETVCTVCSMNINRLIYVYDMLYKYTNTNLGVRFSFIFIFTSKKKIKVCTHTNSGWQFCLCRIQHTDKLK